MELTFMGRHQAEAARLLCAAPALVDLTERGWLTVELHPSRQSGRIEMSADHMAMLSCGERILLAVAASVAGYEPMTLVQVALLDEPNRAAVAAALSALCGYAAVTVRGGVA